MRRRRKTKHRVKHYSLHFDSGMRPKSVRLLSRHVGWYRYPGEETIWEVWTPVGNAGSSWNRLEAPGRRARFMYDAGGHCRRVIEKAKGRFFDKQDWPRAA